MDEGHDVAGRDATVADDVFDPGVHGHDAVERARQGVGVEVEQDLRLAHFGLGIADFGLEEMRSDGTRTPDFKSEIRNPQF